MAIYEYECAEGHRAERIRREADRNEPFQCDTCPETPRLMYRKGIELQKKARVVGGTLQFHRNETRYTRGLG